MDKDKIQRIADELAESMYGKDFYDLSGRQQSEVYEKAIVELNDMMADKADMMRKGEADVVNRFVPCMCAGLAYYMAMKKAPQRVQEMKLIYEDELQRALQEDGSAASVYISPKTYYPEI